jgi:hypothetical protein
LKIVQFVKNDLIKSVVYCEGEIAGFDDWVADNLVRKGFAVLYGDGKVRPAGGKIPGAKDWLDDPGLADHVAKLKKDGAWPAEMERHVELGQPKIMPSTQYGG